MPRPVACNPRLGATKKVTGGTQIQAACHADPDEQEFTHALSVVAVGTVLADGPPHRSRRAELPHRALASGSDDEAHVWVGMHHTDCG
jgi:hypothetical protein